MKTLLLSLLCVCAMGVHAATYYISPTGDDANDGLSRGTPFGTFLHATETMTHGDTLVIMEGTYINPFNRAPNAQLSFGVQTNGTLLNDITIRGDGPDKTIFHYVDGTGTNVTDVYHLRLQGTGNTLTGMKLEGDILGDPWWQPVISVHICTDSIISHIWLEFPDTILERTGISPLWVHGVDNVLIYRCLVDGGGIGGRVFNHDKFHNMTYRNCTFVNQREGGIDRGMGMVVEGNSGTVIEKCVFANNANYGISFWDPEGSLPQATQTVANCVYWNPGEGFLDIRDPARVYVIETGTIHAQPNFIVDEAGLPYTIQGPLSGYGWNGAPTTYYISPTGDDANDGMSRATPFGSFIHATETMNSGDTLVIMEGTYINPANRPPNAQLTFGIQTNGTYLNNITVMGDGPDKTTFQYVDGTGTNVTDAYHLRLQGDGNTLTGLKLEGDILGEAWWQPVISVHNCTDSIISHIWLEFPDTILERTGISPLWVHGVDNVLIYRCLVDGGGIGGRVFNHDKFHNMTYRNCTFVNQREGGAGRGMGALVEGNSGTVIERCVFANNANYGISFWVPEASLPQATQTVANCLYWDPGQGFIENTNTDRIYVVETGTVNTDPGFVVDPDGLAYSIQGPLGAYGWNAIPTTYYISPTGDDLNDGLSRDTPFGTFLHATETMISGDTLVIMEGTYINPANRLPNAQVTFGIQTNGTYLNNITIMGDGPDKTIFHYVDGTGTNVTDAYHLRLQGDGNTLTGLKLEGDILGEAWWQPVISVHNCTDSIISHIWLEFPDTILERTGFSPLWVHGVDNVLIYRCLVDGGGIGGRVFNHDKFHNMTYRNCTFVNQREGGPGRGMGALVEGNSGTVIQNCVFANNANYSISFWQPEASLPKAVQYVVDNLYWQPGQGFIENTNPARIEVVESGTVNVDPEFLVSPEGLPYTVPGHLAAYGWNAMPLYPHVALPADEQGQERTRSTSIAGYDGMLYFTRYFTTNIPGDWCAFYAIPGGEISEMSWVDLAPAPKFVQNPPGWFSGTVMKNWAGDGMSHGIVDAEPWLFMFGSISKGGAGEYIGRSLLGYNIPGDYWQVVTNNYDGGGTDGACTFVSENSIYGYWKGWTPMQRWAWDPTGDGVVQQATVGTAALHPVDGVSVGHAAVYIMFRSGSPNGRLLAIPEGGLSPIQLPDLPFNLGMGCAIEHVPAAISLSGSDELWILRGGTGTDAGDGQGNNEPNDDLLVLTYTNTPNAIAITGQRWLKLPYLTGADGSDMARVDDMMYFVRHNGATSPELYYIPITYDEPGSIGWCNLQWPPTVADVYPTNGVDVVTEMIYGQVWIDGVTSEPGPTADLNAWLGFGPPAAPPTDPSWTWVPADFNVDVGNNDEFWMNMTVVAGTPAGDYAYCYRYQYNPQGIVGEVVYGLLDGMYTIDTIDPDQYGEMTVIPEPASILVLGLLALLAVRRR